MLVNANSWHYKLVNHKEFVSNPKNDNQDACNYIAGVWFAIFCTYLSIPLPVIVIAFVISPGFHQMIMNNAMLIIMFIVAISSPLWFSILLIVIEPFTKKSWRKLRIIGG